MRKFTVTKILLRGEAKHPCHASGPARGHQFRSRGYNPSMFATKPAMRDAIMRALLAPTRPADACPPH